MGSKNNVTNPNRLIAQLRPIESYTIQDGNISLGPSRGSLSHCNLTFADE